MARNVAGAVSLMMKRYRELKLERMWGPNSCLCENLRNMELKVKPSKGVPLHGVVVLLHPDDLERIQFGEKVNAEIRKKMDSLEVKPGWFQSLVNGMSHVLVPASVVQYVMLAYGISGNEAQEKALGKLLADNKVEEKLIKALIDKELNEIQNLIGIM